MTEQAQGSSSEVVSSLEDILMVSQVDVAECGGAEAVEGEEYAHVGEATIDLSGLVMGGGEGSRTAAPLKVRILVGRAVRAKCGRCWRYKVEGQEVGVQKEVGGDVCGRCEIVLKECGEL
jgi:hypothetical protein